MAKLRFVEAKPLMVLPPRPDLCQVCAGKHEPGEPHNPQSLYYQMTFNMQHGRGPNWVDAMAHCDERVKKLWREALVEMGVDVDGGKVLPNKEERPHA
jgi:hypothetical protein